MVFRAAGIVRKARIMHQFRQFQDLAQALPQPIVARGNHDVPVRGLEKLERRDRRMTRTQRAVIDVGLATRVYASEMVSFRIDVRGLSFINADDVQNELWLGLGISL